MAVIKQMDIVAEEIATNVIEDIKKQSDWQVDQFLPKDAESPIINDTHSYLMRLVARHIANKLDINTNKYYDE